MRFLIFHGFGATMPRLPLERRSSCATGSSRTTTRLRTHSTRRRTFGSGPSSWSSPTTPSLLTSPHSGWTGTSLWRPSSRRTICETSTCRRASGTCSPRMRRPRFCSAAAVALARMGAWTRCRPSCVLARCSPWRPSFSTPMLCQAAPWRCRSMRARTARSCSWRTTARPSATLRGRRATRTSSGMRPPRRCRGPSTGRSMPPASTHSRRSP
mmetsp:Transcript_161108/g.517097  ORF Transcript_161108/g.517097 Transcript_161108/m.517097 type:complete len:212 (-) Transcript_161108:238-873(-)